MQMRLDERLAWEDTLVVGDVVTARWTSNYNYYAARATITKVNAKSLRVILEESTGGYPAGWDLLIPRASDIFGACRWSVNNCVCPLAEAAAA